METKYQVKEVRGEGTSKEIILNNEKGSVYFSAKLHPEIIVLFNRLNIMPGELIYFKRTEVGAQIKRVGDGRII